MFHTHTAGGKGGEDDEEERCQEGHWDGNEQQNKEPEDRPRPAESHDHRRMLG